MLKLYKKLEILLSTGYHILEELECSDPGIERIEELYNLRSVQLQQIMTEWNELKNHSFFTDEDGITQEDFKKLLLKLNLIERELDRNMKQLQKQKSDVLKHLKTFQVASQAYGQTNESNSPIFLDTKSTY